MHKSIILCVRVVKATKGDKCIIKCMNKNQICN